LFDDIIINLPESTADHSFAKDPYFDHPLGLLASPKTFL
jgi:hypothetical protein